MTVKPWDHLHAADHEALAKLFNATTHEANALRNECKALDESLRDAKWREDKLREDLERALEDNKQLKEQVQHLLTENEEKRAQLRNFSQRLVQCKWQLKQLTNKW